MGTWVSSGLSSDGGTVGIGLRGLFQSKQFSDSVVELFCNALQSVLVPPAAPVPHSLLPEHPARAPLPSLVWWSCCSSLPQSCCQTKGEQGSPAWGQQSFFAVVSSQQWCSWRTRGCARPTPTPRHLYWCLLCFCPASITSKGLDSGEQPVCKF